MFGGGGAGAVGEADSSDGCAGADELERSWWWADGEAPSEPTGTIASPVAVTDVEANVVSL